MVRAGKERIKAPCAIFILGRAFVRDVLTIRNGRIVFVCSNVFQKKKPKVMRKSSCVVRYIAIRSDSNMKIGRNNDARSDRKKGSTVVLYDKNHKTKLELG